MVSIQQSADSFVLCCCTCHPLIRLLRAPPQAEAGVSSGPCLLQAAHVLPIPSVCTHRAHPPTEPRRAERPLPNPHRGDLRARRRDLRAPGRAILPTSTIPGGVPSRGPSRDLLRHRRPPGENRPRSGRHRRGRRRVQHLLAGSVPLRDDRRAVWAPERHPQLQPLRHGLRRQPRRGRPREEPAPCAPGLHRPHGRRRNHHSLLLQRH
ncbi:uncharacterized protein M6B38_272705 [Iris pallida]|uniref:Uncharacterized protein n=1 Tax=Iris pallida TaxID=29817 RepID=A0AAX6I8V5_IRIPA|nr:uncharacterized protein M6B38_272705 [Iris pallida]